MRRPDLEVGHEGAAVRRLIRKRHLARQVSAARIADTVVAEHQMVLS